MVWTGSLADFAAGENPTAAKMQVQVDALHGLTDAESSWSPVVKYGTTAWSNGNAVIDATYRRAGKLVFVSMGFKLGSTTSGNAGTGGLFVVPPVAPRRSAADFPVGFGFCIDSSPATNYPVLVFYQASAAALSFIVMATSAQVMNSSPFTWAANDEMRINCTYECS